MLLHELCNVDGLAETNQNLATETEIITVFYTDGLNIYRLTFR